MRRAYHVGTARGSSSYRVLLAAGQPDERAGLVSVSHVSGRDGEESTVYCATCRAGTCEHCRYVLDLIREADDTGGA